MRCTGAIDAVQEPTLQQSFAGHPRCVKAANCFGAHTTGPKSATHSLCSTIIDERSQLEEHIRDDKHVN